MRFLIALAALLVFSKAIAQEATTAPPVTVTLQAKDADLRKVLADLFDQAKKQYVLDPALRATVFVSLKDTDYRRALSILAAQANFVFEVRDDVYFVRRAPAQVAPSRPATPATTPGASPEPKAEPAPQGPLPQTVLTRRITTRLGKTDMRDVFLEIGKQAQVRIEVRADVPRYRLDAFLINTSLKFALDEITKAAQLEWAFTNNRSIVIRKPEQNRVAVVQETRA
jgi:type II secretory pathway component GspD/PulD (secretin)